MAYTAKDIISLSQARANLSELLDEVRGGTEKIITKNGESCAALISTEKLEMYYRMEKARIHLVLLRDAVDGLRSLESGESRDAREVVAEIKARRAAEKRERGDADRE